MGIPLRILTKVLDMPYLRSYNLEVIPRGEDEDPEYVDSGIERRYFDSEIWNKIILKIEDITGGDQS